MSITYMKNLQLIDDRVNNLMRTLIVIFIVVLFAYLVSCDGSDGNGNQELTVFDVTISVLEVESQIGAPTDCPESADLKLSLIINGNSISGFAELIGFGKVGDASAVSGEIINNEFTLEPFRVSVTGDLPPDPSFPASGILFDFQQFQGVFIEESEASDKIEGVVSGKVFENIFDAVICDANFSGEFSGEEKIPIGCVSAAEITLDENRDCPAEAISNLCDGVSYLCSIPESNPPPGLFLIDNSWEAIDCVTIGNPSPFITNLELNIFGSIIGGNFITTGEPLLCFGPPS